MAEGQIGRRGQTVEPQNQIFFSFFVVCQFFLEKPGDHVTLADIQTVGEVLALQVLLKFDLSKFPNIKKWLSEMEKSMKTGWNSLQAMYDELVKEHIAPKPQVSIH